MNADEEIPSQEDLEAKRLREEQAAEDAEVFGMQGMARTGDVSIEETKATNRKMVKMWVIVGIISFILVASMAVSYVGYYMFREKPLPPGDVAGKNKTLPPPKVTQVKIKKIDRDNSTIELLIRDGVKQTFPITPETEFLDASEQRIPQGFDTPALRVEDLAWMLTTDDGKGLRWLKLTR